MNHNTDRSTVTAKVLKAMSIFSGVQSITILCSIVRTKFVSIWIGEAGVGLFGIFNTVLEMVSTATQLNMRQSAVRDISVASAADVPKIAGVIRWWSKRLGMFGAVLMLLLSPLLSIVSFGDLSWWWAFALLSVAVYTMSYTSGEQALMQGTDRLHQLAKSTMAGALGGTVFSIPLYYLFGIGSIIPSLLLFAIFCLISAVRYNDIKSSANTPAYNRQAGKDFIKLGLYLTVSSVVTTVASYIFISYITQTESIDDTGLYQAGYTLVIRYTGIIFTALAMEYFPRITQITDRPKMASTVVSHEIVLVLYVLTPLLVIFVAADRLAVIILYKESFLRMLPFVTICIGAMIYRAVSYCIAYVIISRGDGKAYIFTEVLSSAVGLTLNIVMFNLWGFAGLGLSYVLWYIIYTLIVWVVYHRYGMTLSRDCIKLILTSTVIVSAAIILKHYGWWAVTPMIIASLLLSYKGYKHLK